MGRSLPRALVLFSGGIDSVSCAHLLREQGFAVSALFLDYGQAARLPESRSVRALAKHLNLAATTVKLSGAGPFQAGEISGRNAFFVFTGLMIGQGEYDLLALGVHSGTRYYDCSSRFVESMERLVAEHTDGRVSFCAPFAKWTKGQVYEYFASTTIPITLTYSCETGAVPQCGQCLSCRDRESL